MIRQKGKRQLLERERKNENLKLMEGNNSSDRRKLEYRASDRKVEIRPYCLQLNNKYLY